MCAAMPMFRVRSSGNLRFGEFGPADADFFFSSVAGINLPTKMGKRAVRLRHFVCVFAFLDRVALTGGRVLNFLGERLSHRHAFASIGVLNAPARCQRNLARGWHFQRHLISRATDSARFHFQARTDVLDRLVYDFERIDRIGTFARFLNRGVDNALGERFLAALHHRGDETRDRRTPVTGIDALFLFVNSLPSRHCRSFVSKIYFFSSFGAASFAPAAGFAPPPPPPAPPFGRFAPYLERLRRRPSTPNESSVPRTMW